MEVWCNSVTSQRPMLCSTCLSASGSGDTCSPSFLGRHYTGGDNYVACRGTCADQASTSFNLLQLMLRKASRASLWGHTGDVCSEGAVHMPDRWSAAVGWPSQVCRWVPALGHRARSAITNSIFSIYFPYVVLSEFVVTAPTLVGTRRAKLWDAPFPTGSSGRAGLVLGHFGQRSAAGWGSVCTHKRCPPCTAAARQRRTRGISHTRAHPRLSQRLGCASAAEEGNFIDELARLMNSRGDASAAESDAAHAPQPPAGLSLSVAFIGGLAQHGTA